ncbi:uncharacterized protein G2W53_032952 [Senna tora]|uniref:Uncharacterized protein n=1 Tax=Senna tora TaxID=362788 RepID=A0A834SYB1_9FABA|nr:uncharacterized protein G2W53_032952 [Senna tora]
MAIKINGGSTYNFENLPLELLGIGLTVHVQVKFYSPTLQITP